MPNISPNIPPQKKHEVWFVENHLNPEKRKIKAISLEKMGQTYLKNRDFQRARACYERSSCLSHFNLSLNPQSGEAKEVALRVDFFLQEIYKVLGMKSQKDKEIETPPANIELATFYRNLSQKSSQKKNFQEALSYLQKSSDTLSNLPMHVAERAKTSNAMGEVLLSLGKREEAIDSFEKGLELLNGEEILQLEIANNLSRVAHDLYNEGSNDDQAIALFHKALEIQEKFALNSEEMGSSLIGLGFCFIEKHNSEKSIEYLSKGIEILRRGKQDRSTLQKASYWTGICYKRINRPNMALKMYLLSLENSDYSSAIELIDPIEKLLDEIKDSRDKEAIDEAVKDFLKIAKIYKSFDMNHLNDAALEIFAYLLPENPKMFLKDRSGAFIRGLSLRAPSFKAAFNRNFPLGSLLGGEAYLEMACLYGKKKMSKESRECLEKALNYFEHNPETNVLCVKVLLEIGQIHLLEGNISDAYEAAQKSMKICEEKKLCGITLADTFGFLGKISHLKGELDNSQDYFEKSATIREKISRKEDRKMQNQFCHSEARQVQSEVNLFISEGKLNNAMRILEIFSIPLGILKQNIDLLGINYLNIDRVLLLEAEAKVLIEQAKDGGSDWEGEESCYEDFEFSWSSKVDDAEEILKTCLKFMNSYYPSSLMTASCYYLLGECARIKKQNRTAQNSYKKALDIQTKVASEGIDYIRTLYAQGVLFQDSGAKERAREDFTLCLLLSSGKYPEMNFLSAISLIELENDPDKILKKYEEYIESFQKDSPESKSLMILYQKASNIYEKQGKLEKAIELLTESLKIRRKLMPDTPGTSDLVLHLGDLFSLQKNFDKALEFYQKALPENKKYHNPYAIKEIYEKIASTHRILGNLKAVLTTYQELYSSFSEIQQDDPNALEIATKIGRIAIELDDFSTAKQYAEKILQADSTYKFGYDILGLSLLGQKKYEEAISEFENALSYDEGYADAKIHLIQAHSELSKRNKNFDSSLKEIESAFALKQSSYDDLKLKELKEVALRNRPQKRNGLNQNGEIPQEIKEEKAIIIHLPSSQYQSETDLYIRKIEELHAEILAMRNQVQELHKTVTKIEKKMNGLSDVIGVIRKDVEKIDRSIKGLSEADPVLEKLLTDRKKLEQREEIIKSFSENLELRHYFYSFLSTLEEGYITAHILQSEKFQQVNEKQSSAQIAGDLFELIPIIGKAASILVKGAGALHDFYSNVKSKVDFSRIRNLASSLEEFNSIAVRIAVDITKKQQSKLRLLGNEKIPDDWKSKLGTLSDHGGAALLERFLKENDTQAKVLGRIDAFRVLSHLKEEGVSELLAELKEDPLTQKRKASVIRDKIIDSVFTESSPLLIPKGKEKEKQNLPPQIKDMVTDCLNYTSNSPDKTAAARKLKEVLEKEPPIIALAYIQDMLRESSLPIFESSFFRKSDLLSLFEKCRDSLASIIKEKQKEMSRT